MVHRCLLCSEGGTGEEAAALSAGHQHGAASLLARILPRGGKRGDEREDHKKKSRADRGGELSRGEELIKAIKQFLSQAR